MAYFWNPFCGAEIENQNLILRLPDSGMYVLVEGPIVELLSQLPFTDIEASVRDWRERTHHADALVQDASKVWHKLCDWGVILDQEIKGKLTASNGKDWFKIDGDIVQSRIVRFGDSQEFYGEEEVFHLGA
jgi:hypothetical protein